MKEVEEIRALIRIPLVQLVHAQQGILDQRAIVGHLLFGASAKSVSKANRTPGVGLAR